MIAVSENVAGTFQRLRENGLRSLLTMLGIVIGVGSVVLLIAIAEGVKLEVSRQIKSLGANVLFVLPGKIDRSGRPNTMALLGISTLTESDVEKLRAVSGVVSVVPVMFVAGSAAYESRACNAVVIATTNEIQSVRARPLVEGRFFGHDEGDSRVCVLAQGPRRELFGDGPAVGRTILIRDIPFTVLGILEDEEESPFGQGGFSSVIYLPYDAVKHALQGGQINRVFVSTEVGRSAEPVIADVRAKLLRDHGGREDFAVVTQKQLLGTVVKIFDLVPALLVGISAISLFVAGIGIMNIMLVTVTERTREIGLRKSVGARARDVFVQFLTESLVLSFLGGAIGLAIATVLCAAVTRFSPLHPAITLRLWGRR